MSESPVRPRQRKRRRIVIADSDTESDGEASEQQSKEKDTQPVEIIEGFNPDEVSETWGAQKLKKRKRKRRKFVVKSKYQFNFRAASELNFDEDSREQQHSSSEDDINNFIASDDEVSQQLENESDLNSEQLNEKKLLIALAQDLSQILELWKNERWAKLAHHKPSHPAVKSLCNLLRSSIMKDRAKMQSYDRLKQDSCAADFVVLLDSCGKDYEDFPPKGLLYRCTTSIRDLLQRKQVGSGEQRDHNEFLFESCLKQKMGIARLNENHEDECLLCCGFRSVSSEVKIGQKAYYVGNVCGEKVPIAIALGNFVSTVRNIPFVSKKTESKEIINLAMKLDRLGKILHQEACRKISDRTKANGLGRGRIHTYTVSAE